MRRRDRYARPRNPIRLRQGMARRPGCGSHKRCQGNRRQRTGLTARLARRISLSISSNVGARGRLNRESPPLFVRNPPTHFTATPPTPLRSSLSGHRVAQGSSASVRTREKGAREGAECGLRYVSVNASCCRLCDRRGDLDARRGRAAGRAPSCWLALPPVGWRAPLLLLAEPAGTPRASDPSPLRLVWEYI
jgi:hypothetical protein